MKTTVGAGVHTRNRSKANPRAPTSEDRDRADARSLAAREDAPFLAQTIPGLLLERVARSPHLEAFRYPSGESWGSLTWAAALARVQAIAGALIEHGVGPGDCVAIVSATRVEWILADLAVQCAGGVTAAVHPTIPAEERAFVLADCGASIVLVGGAELAAAIEKDRSRTPAVQQVICLDAGFEPNLAKLEEQGRDFLSTHPTAVSERISAVRADDLASIIYTSGTTGQPRGVEITQGAWLAQARAMVEAGMASGEGLVQYVWLPFAHSYGRAISVSHLQFGFTMVVEGRPDHLMTNLARVRPDLLCVVPRVLEKVRDEVFARAARQGRAASALLAWALRAGESWRCGPRTARRWTLLPAFLVADSLVLSRVRAAFGGRLDFLMSGGAAVAPEVSDFYRATGLPILEGYGLTETAAITHGNPKEDPRFGTVGKPLPGVEVRIARDGEVLVRAPWIMRGYHNRPRDTGEVLDSEGWVHTGDIGTVDGDGYLSIVDRKKDLIKTSAGEYVAPQQLEARLASLCPLISQALVYGDRSGHLHALVTIDEGAAKARLLQNGSPLGAVAALTEHPTVLAAIETATGALNATLPRHSAIHGVRVLPGQFTVENGSLTPSLKLRRSQILAQSGLSDLVKPTSYQAVPTRSSS